MGRVTNNVVYHIANSRMVSNGIPCRRNAGKETNDGQATRIGR